MQDFIQLILKNLNNNGFPEKKVSLPTEKMYEVADNRGLSFNAVLEELKEKHQIIGDVETDKIVFTAIPINAPSEDMMKKAQEAMSKMSPDELKRIQEMFMNMSEDEKADMMQKGKDMGLI